MRQRVNRVMSKLSLFWRYFFLLAAVVLVFLISFTVAARQFSKSLQTSYLEQARSNFQKNGELFSSSLFLTHALPMAMEDTDNYLPAAAASQAFTNQDIFYLTEIRDAFAIQCSMLDLPAESFIYLRQNGACLTRHRLFSDVTTCFETYLVYDAQASVLEQLQSRESRYGPRLLPVSRVSVGGKQAEHYLTLLVHGTAGDAIYGFLYPADYVLECFQIDDLPADTYLELTSADGTPLFSYGNAGGPQTEYIRLTCELPTLACTVAIGIPRAYFHATMRSAQTTAQVIFLCSVVLGIALCFLFSHVSVRPFRRLLQAHAGDQTRDRHGNELVAIDSVLKSTREKNAAMRGMLLSSLLVRAFSGLAIPEEEYARIAEAFPLFRECLQAAVVRDRSSGCTPVEHVPLINRLRDALPEQFLCEYINMQESIVLFPADPAALELLQSVLQELNRGSEREARFVCGVSASFVGVNEVGSCIRQAQFCIPEGGERILVSVAEEGTVSGTVPADDFDMRLFRQALASWSRHEVLTQIDRLASAGKRGAVAPEEMFYSVLFLLRDTARSGKISFEAYEKMSYQHTGSPGSNLRRLKAVVNDLFEQKAALQMTDKQLLCEEIVQHIRCHFSDATLCMAALAKQFCVSERFVYNAVMDITGMNVSNFLAQTRMQEAARLLRETDENVSSIAEKCGYPVESTFYRNFKKIYHVTPAEYKSALY